MTTITAIIDTLIVPESDEPRRTFVEPIGPFVHAHQSPRYWDWLQLYDDDATASPFQHPDVALVDLAHAPQDRHSGVLVGVEEQGRCVGLLALAPKTVSTRRIGGIGPGWTLHGCRLIGDASLQRRPDQQLTQELLQLALQHVAESRAGFLLIEDLDEASPLAAALAATLSATWRTFRHAGVQPRRRIRLPETPEQYWSKFSSKTRSTFRRKLKKFGQTRLDRITTIEQVPGFLDAAHRISVQTWQSRQLGLRVRNDDAELAQFTTLAGLGLLRCYLWLVNDEPVAFTIGHQDKGCFHYEEVGYVTAHARHSPGQMMLLQMIDDLILHDRPEWFDFGGGDADYKQLFATHESRSGTVWLFPPSVCNRLTVAYLKGCHGLRHALRRGIGGLGLASRFRQLVRYGGRTTAAATVGPETEATPPDTP